MVFCYSCVVICLKWLFNEYLLTILNKESALVAAYTAARQVVSLGRALVAAIEVDYASHRFVTYHLQHYACRSQCRSLPSRGVITR